jgi:hypothetical protein
VRRAGYGEHRPLKEFSSPLVRVRKKNKRERECKKKTVEDVEHLD